MGDGAGDLGQRLALGLRLGLLRLNAFLVQHLALALDGLLRDLLLLDGLRVLRHRPPSCIS